MLTNDVICCIMFIGGEYMFYTVEEVAEKLRMHPESVRRLIRQGKIKASKGGNKWLIEQTDLEKYLRG